MNVKAIQWLLAHRDVLMKVVEVAKNFSRHTPYIDQWNVIDQIARLLIPVLASEEVKVSEIATADWDDYEQHELALLATGAEVQSLGIDWKQLIEVILPIVLAILDALNKKS